MGGRKGVVESSLRPVHEWFCHLPVSLPSIGMPEVCDTSKPSNRTAGLHVWKCPLHAALYQGPLSTARVCHSPSSVLSCISALENSDSRAEGGACRGWAVG